ncbi:hypothetical protein GUITHDRAFT_134789 [Guillardia theta CCMP2712]|uniref:Uncharacterized protein n=1 Tax=Guillardia theta (strain CCMP2712) TaxID=905079 RepID=L1JTB9_GUITC|nr:hypothetical protein GUITHDRAFT_134789 [Guillardia theta CCMP2712]EKX51313.1 hypothetical protein GUITHDRAFT_134789 [Guillardia theta CCMP2712]|eukprot:XP_005838293.1 hypothetical protein GUITHDRAFT_134789 [Guillardia theta CCMP2712]
MAGKSKQGKEGGGGGSKGDEGALNAFLKWASDEEAVRKWQREINLRKILGTRPNVMSKDKRERGNGVLARLTNFFPDEVAEGAAIIASRVPEERWNMLEWNGDASQPCLDGISAAHRFGAVVDPSDLVGVSELYHVLSGLMPPSADRYSAFHLGRLQQGDFVGSQDDAAYCVVDRSVNDPSRSGIAKCSRDIAVMLFLGKDQGKGGSIFRDLYHEMPTAADSYELEFNSLMAFHVPREYELTINQSDSTCFFLFGWFLKEGELYELEESKGPAECQQGLSKKKSVKLTAKRKLRARREEAYQVPAEFLKLAEEREEARRTKDFERADRIREICSSAGLKFNAGGRLMKSKDFSEKLVKEALLKLQEKSNPSSSSSSASKSRKKESKTERILRQAREAQEAEGKKEERKGEEEEKKPKEHKKAKEEQSSELAGSSTPAGEKEEKKASKREDVKRAGKRKAEEEEEEKAMAAAAVKKEPKKPKKPKKPKDEEEEKEAEEGAAVKEVSRRERNQQKKLDMIKRRGWLGVKQ